MDFAFNSFASSPAAGRIERRALRAALRARFISISRLFPDSNPRDLFFTGTLLKPGMILLCMCVLLSLATAPLAATTVYLPAPGAPTSYTITGATTGTPIVVTVSGAVPSNGTALWIYNVGGQACANGFWITAGASGSTFQLKYMYYGGNAVGTTANCTGTYTSGGTAVVLTAYTLTPHPRVWLDGPSGPITTSLANTGSNGKSNINNAPFAALTNRSASYWASTNYQATNADQSSDYPFCCYQMDYAATGFLWFATGDSTDLSVAQWGIDHVEQSLWPTGNFYCAGDQCGNNTVTNYVSGMNALFQVYSMIRSHLSSTEIQNFKDKILNDSAYLNNGLGVSENSANPLTTSCTNSNWSTWVDSANYCGLLFDSRYLTFSPNIAPGQEGHYVSDYVALNPTSSGPGLSDQWPHTDNLGLSKLANYIIIGLALADDDVRAQVLLTQAYTYYHRWYWAYATSTWTARNSGSRYTSFNVGTLPAQVAAAVKQSGGPDITSGTYLANLMPLTIYQSLPGWPASYNYTDQWGDVYTPDNDEIDWANVLAVPLWLYNSSSTFAPYANYFMNNVMSYTAGEFGGESFQVAFLPYLYVDPTFAQTNVSGLPTQFLFRDTDYSNCVATFGSTPASGNTQNQGGNAGCYPDSAYSGAISKSDWTSTATQIDIQASYNQDNFDHSGCGLWGSYHIYRKDYLLAGDGTPTSTAPNGAAHSDCTGAISTDILIELGGADNWNTSSGTVTAGGTGWAYATIPRWASTDPTGDSSSRYMYMLADITPSYTSSANASRVQRSLVHFKKASTQDYVVSYDDVALTSGTQVQDWMMYWNSPASGTQSINAAASSRTVVSKNTAVGNFLASSFLPVAGSNTIAMIATGVTGVTNRNYLCPSTTGATCNNSATSFEVAVVHKPSTNPSDSMPTVSQPTCTGTGGNCTVVDIQDSSYPKVAVFARQGALLTAASFASTHAGTAQYLIAGLEPSFSYAVTLNGATIAGSPFTVAAGDDTLYFEGSSGAYVITQYGGTGTQAPAIASFSATPAAIIAGQPSLLAWSVTGNPKPALSISPGVGTVTGSSVSVSPQTTTTYTLTATNSAGSATATVKITVTPDTTPPSVPGNLTAKAVSSSQINLSWTASTDNVGVVGYRVYRNGTQVGTTSQTSYSDTGLAASTTYIYTVAAYDAAGNVSAQSAPVSATTLAAGQAPAIVSFTATPASIAVGQSSTLSWSVTGSPAPALSINQGVGTVTGATSISVSPTTTTTYTLTATNGAGSASANSTVTVGTDPPPAPTNPAATATSATTVNFSWSASNSAVGYKIYRGGMQVGTTTGEYYSDTGLTPSTTYTYTVMAYNTGGGVSPPSPPASAATPAGPSLGGCPVFPANDVWNTPINNLPVDPNSAAYINTIGSSTPLHADFSSTGGGIPYDVVPASQPLVTVDFVDNSQGDPGPYPIPANAQIEQGSDHHVLVVDQGNCKLYELWEASLNSDGVTWSANNGAVFDLNSNILRPSGWTSSDAAGLPVLPGLVKYSEVMSGQINHAIRMTAPQTLDNFIWPARHEASSLTGTQYPPMGERFRLQAGFNVTSFPAPVQVILNALKEYGAILADNGSSWYLTGVPNSLWNDSEMAAISQVLGSNMEAVAEPSLTVEANSGSVAKSPMAPVGIYLNQREVNAGATVTAQAILTAAAPSGGATVSVASSNSGAVSAPATVTIPAGSVSVSVPITIGKVAESTPVVLSSTYGSVTAPSPVLLVNGTSNTLVPLLSAMSLSVRTVTGGTKLTGTVTLFGAAPSGGTTVALSSSNTTAASVPPTVTVAAGATTASFMVTTYAQTSSALATIKADLNGENLGVPIAIAP